VGRARDCVCRLGGIPVHAKGNYLKKLTRDGKKSPAAIAISRDPSVNRPSSDKRLIGELIGGRGSCMHSESHGAFHLFLKSDSKFLSRNRAAQMECLSFRYAASLQLTRIPGSCTHRGLPRLCKERARDTFVHHCAQRRTSGSGLCFSSGHWLGHSRCGSARRAFLTSSCPDLRDGRWSRLPRECANVRSKRGNRFTDSQCGHIFEAAASVNRM
jgi:hypothetical protein